ncbi:MAG TPA: transglutaminaseTgpA domain-containing protein [Acidimicrobiales bacterium]|nr:transglutaminaseTgpA domain-containing protein [Acidimicrobiales bacterium]
MSLLERLKAVNARPEPEESVALRVTVLVAVMASALALVTQGVGGPLLKLAVAGIPGAFWFSHHARYRDGFWLKGGLAIGVLTAFAWFLGSVGGVEPGSLVNVQLPLAQLFLWVQLLHALDVPSRRDLMFSVVSSLVLMAVAGVLSISMNLLWYVLIWAVAAAASLVLAYRSELSSLPALARSGLTGPGPGDMQEATRMRDMGRVLRGVAGTVTVVMMVATGAFYLLPPAGQARALTFPSELARVLPVPKPGGLSNPTLGNGDPGRDARSDDREGASSFGYFGFSNSLDTGVRGRPDDTLVMRVRASKPDFWRGQTFDVWDGRRWTLSTERFRILSGEPPLTVPAVPGEDKLLSGPGLVQTYYLEKAGPNVIFGAQRVSRLHFPDRQVFQLSDGTLRAGVALLEDAAYTVVSNRPPVTEQILRAADRDPSGIPPAIATRYLRLPALPDRVSALAEKVTASAPTVYDKVRALEAWMGRNTRYSLDIPSLPNGADAVERYLFEDRTGFCEQIATSLVVMMRHLGVPARLAVGYTPGQRNPFTGLYEVKGSDAHAWAEVWFPGIGWQSFDPTAKVPLAGDGGLSRASSGIGSYLAARLPHPPAWAIAALVVLVVVAVVAAAVVRIRAVLSRRRRRRPRSWAEACLARMERVGAARGHQRRPSETVREYAASLRRHGVGGSRLDEAAAIVTRDAFSGRPATAAERELVDKVIEEVGSKS